MNIAGSCISFPFRVDERGSIVTTADKSRQIAEAIADIIETRRGERVYLPDFGLPDFVFSVMDSGFAARLAYHLDDQIGKYVPLVESIEVRSAIDEEGRAVAEVRYRERGSILAPKNLVFPVWKYTGGGAV